MSRHVSESDVRDAIAAYRFALIDLSLFLDTHPENGDALARFSDYRNKLRELENVYTQNFAPLSIRDVSGKNGWTWGDTPMPEEGVL